MTRWIIYGAYGYTGRLIVEEAVKRGHQPMLAGRNAAKLAPLGERFDLDWMAFNLEDESVLAQIVTGFDLVFHAAGPFIHTNQPMVRACLASGAHYLDITGEIPVFQNTFSHDEQARRQGVALISGAGFDIVPTDCLARYVAQQLTDAVELEIAFSALGGTSAGTAKTMLEMLPTMPEGGLVRRQGRLVPHPLGQGSKRIYFSHGKQRTVMPIPWGDLATAQHSTSIPNVTTYMAFPPSPGIRLVTPVASKALAFDPVRQLAQKLVEKTVTGPDKRARQTGRSYVWAQATDADGQMATAWLETIETYRFTAVAGVHCIEETLAQNPTGALTPSMAFGPDFVLAIEGTRRYDTLPV